MRVHVASTTTTTTAACSSSSNSAPPPPRRALLVDQRGSRIKGPLKNESGGEFTFELIENYPSLGLSAVDDGSGTIINWRGAMGQPRVHRSSGRRDKDFLDHETIPSPRTRATVLDPYLPTFQHLLCDYELVTSSLHLKNYPVCENDLFDVNSKCAGECYVFTPRKGGKGGPRCQCGPLLQKCHRSRVRLVLQVSNTALGKVSPPRLVGNRTSKCSSAAPTTKPRKSWCFLCCLH